MDQANVSKAPIMDDLSLLTTRRRILLGGAAAATAISFGLLRNPLRAWADDGGASDDDQEALTILKFSTLAGIQKPFLGDAGLSAFRGVHGGGAPWIISEGTGSLRSDGQLKVRVRGLVLDPAFVPPPNGGTNPIPFFMAIVSGFSKDLVKPVNLSTPIFPASTAGDATIAVKLTLPDPFFAPIVFVASLPLPVGSPAAAPRWFAVTGMQ